MKKFFATGKEARKFKKEFKKNNPYDTTHNVYDLKKTHPRRIKTRFMFGDYFDWLEL